MTTPFPRVPLKSVCTINPRRTPNLDKLDAELVSFVPMTAVDGQSGTILDRQLQPFSKVKKGYTYFEDDDVIFAKITPCMQNGKHAICRGLKHGFGFGSTEFHVLRPGPHLLPEWLHFYLRQPELLAEAEHFFTGSVGQQRLPEDYLAECLIPLPLPAEQVRIVAELTASMATVEKARLAAQKQLHMVQALPAALLREVFASAEA